LHSAAGHSWTLTTQILVAPLSLLLTVVLVGFLFALISSQTLDRQYQLRALGIATTIAQVPEIRSVLASGDPK
jgi:two-component system CitB family sensor kinase